MKTKFRNLLAMLVIIMCEASPAAGDSLGETGIHMTGQTYTRVEKAMPAYTLVEYANDHGVIFAVTWVGRVHPNLESILGVHTSKYRGMRDEHKRKRGDRGHRRLMSPELVVESSGHMRTLRGRAYLPKLLPVGVSLDEIQ
jgi:hypothetical protein